MRSLDDLIQFDLLSQEVLKTKHAKIWETVQFNFTKLNIEQQIAIASLAVHTQNYVF